MKWKRCDKIKWARSCENVSYDICEQQRCRSACASAQSDQHLCYSRPRLYNAYNFYTWNSKTLASRCSWADRFESYLVENVRRHIFAGCGSNENHGNATITAGTERTSRRTGSRCNHAHLHPHLRGWQSKYFHRRNKEKDDGLWQLRHERNANDKNSTSWTTVNPARHLSGANPL